METRICKTCLQEFPQTTDFFSYVSTSKNKDGSKYRTFRGSCKKCMSQKVRSWQIKNPDKLHENEEKRQKLKKDAIGSYESNDIERILQNQNNKCYYCGDELGQNQQIDHKLPLSKGGTNYPSNLVVACRTCNLDKHAKNHIEFFSARIEMNQKINTKSYQELNQ